MSGLDVEALLDSTAANGANSQEPPSKNRDREREERHKGDRSERRDRDRHRDGSRDRDRERKRRDRSRDRRRDKDGDEDMNSPKSDRASANGSHRSRKRSRSRDSDRRHSRRDRHGDDSYRGDFYRGSRHGRSRSKSPADDRYYRPGVNGRARREEMEPDGDRPRSRREDDRKRRRSPSPKKRAKSKTPEPQLTEDERDRRTVFVQQLAARLRTKELIQFFEKVGPVKEAQIVKDRVSGRSKGWVYFLSCLIQVLTLRSVGYVEFRQEESVQLAIQLTGQKLLGIPIIAQLTEAEKNRQARNPEASTGNHNSVPFHRLYVGNIHFSITESDLQNVFEPFGELEFVQLQKEEQGRSRGYGFVQYVLHPPSAIPILHLPSSKLLLLLTFDRFRDPNQAREALEKMNGFDLAGRPIRVGLGNDKFTPESTANLLQRFQGQGPGPGPGQLNFQGSAFSGSGGRGAQAGGSGGNFDRAGGRDNEKGAGGASALDDTDVAGVNFNNYSRDALMRKLARTDEPAEPAEERRRITQPKAESKPLPVAVSQASRCVLLRNMFNPAE